MKKDKKYKVKQDSMDHFNPGDIVVALEDENPAYCTYVDKYEPDKDIGDYADEDFYALTDIEVEEI